MTTNSENLHAADQVYFLYDPQPVRLLDVIYVGPVMIYGGIMGKNLPAFVRWSLVGVGICTIVYNGANFFINEKKAREKREAEGKGVKIRKDADIMDEVFAKFEMYVERKNAESATQNTKTEPELPQATVEVSNMDAQPLTEIIAQQPEVTTETQEVPTAVPMTTKKENGQSKKRSVTANE